MFKIRGEGQDKDKESVHLCDFPVTDEKMIDEKLNKEMELTRKIIEMGLSLRAESGIKVRQPLENLQFSISNLQIGDDFTELIKDEVNVKNVEIVDEIKENDELKVKEDNNLRVSLNVEITPKLKLEGQIRKLVRHIQQTRKEVGFEVNDRIKVWYKGGEDIINAHKDVIKREVLAEALEEDDESVEANFNKKVKVDDIEIEIWLKKI